MPWKFPDTKSCCGCISDLKIATVIIAVLGIVTSPVVSWAAVRHSYMIRVSCFVTTNENRPDIIDINFNNILSFGFGTNAGLGASCLGLGVGSNATTIDYQRKPSSSFIITVKYIGWIVLFNDIVFVFACIYLLYSIFKGSDVKSTRYFIWTACLSIVSSFIYGILFVATCISTGGAFPIFEFVFSIIDISGVYLVNNAIYVWVYFLFVVQSYRRTSMRLPLSS